LLVPVGSCLVFAASELSTVGCVNATGKPQLLAAHKTIAMFACQPHAADFCLC